MAFFYTFIKHSIAIYNQNFYFQPLNRYLRTELISIDEKIQSLQNEESALAPVVAENRKHLESLIKSIRDSEQEHYMLTRQAGDIEAFEYPQQPEVSVMVR